MLPESALARLRAPDSDMPALAVLDLDDIRGKAVYRAHSTTAAPGSTKSDLSGPLNRTHADVVT